MVSDYGIHTSRARESDLDLTSGCFRILVTFMPTTNTKTERGQVLNLDIRGTNADSSPTIKSDRTDDRTKLDGKENVK